jgi:outer membrane murein-binding lipoprotein Lpp
VRKVQDDNAGFLDADGAFGLGFRGPPERPEAGRAMGCTGAGSPPGSSSEARPGSTVAAAVVLVLLAGSSAGCVGYVMGWSDAEVDRLRRIVAELEAKNAALVEEVIELRSARAPAPAGAQGAGEAVDGRTDDEAGEPGPVVTEDTPCPD